MLLKLKADQLKPVFLKPISPIPGLEMFDAVKCQIPRCPSPFVFSDQRRFNEHCAEHHHGVRKVSSKVKAHKLSNMRATQQMVEVIPPTSACPQSLMNDLEDKLSSLQLYALLQVFQPSSNECSKGTLFAQLGWDHLLVGICICDLRGTVATPPDLDCYNRLTLSVQTYYSSISPLIHSLPILTAHAILSTGELGSQPFKTVQEKDMLK